MATTLYDLLPRDENVILNTPTGSGKSLGALTCNGAVSCRVGFASANKV